MALVVSNLQSNRQTKNPNKSRAANQLSWEEAGNMRRHLRLPGPPHAELGTPWEKGKRVCHRDKSGSLTLRQPNYIQICCVHIKVWGFPPPPRNNGALQSKNWATKTRQRINSPLTEQRSRDSQVLSCYGGFKQQPPPPINKTRAATL